MAAHGSRSSVHRAMTPALQALMQFLDAWPAPPPRDPGEADGMRMRLLLGAMRREGDDL